MKSRNLLYLLILTIVFLPLLPIILWSFSHKWFFPDLWPQSWGLRSWHYILGPAGTQITAGLIQSLFVAAITAVLSVAFAVPAGRFLGLYDFRWKNALLMAIMLPLIVPPLCVAMGLHLWFLRLGLTESIAGVVLIHLTISLPYAVLVMWGVFSNYNPEFEEQARSLGASFLRIQTRITFPMISSGMVVAGLFAFLISWSQYLSTLIIGGGQITTLPILLFALMGSGDRPVAAAVSLVFIAPAIFALIFSSKHLSKRYVAGIH